jgi:hypothetical protein
MFRSIAIRTLVAVAVIAAVSCCSAVSRAETLSPTFAGPGAHASQGVLGSFGTMPSDSATPVSPAGLKSLASGNETIAYHSGLAKSSFGSEVVHNASRMGFGFETVPFESFLNVAATPNGDNMVRTFIIIESEKSEAADSTLGSTLGQTAGDDLVNKFTQSSFGSTTTSGSATLSYLQVSPASSSLVFTNVLLKNDPQVTE